MKNMALKVSTFIIGIGLLLCGISEIISVLDGNSNKQESDDRSASIVSETEYRASCEEIPYKDLLRYPDQYKGRNISVKVKVQQVMDVSTFSTDKAWRAETDNDGYGWYYDDEYYMVDKRSGDSVKILEGDIIIVYGEFTGLKEVTRSLTWNSDELPKIEVKYADLVDDAPEKTYEEVYEEYAQKLRDATPTLIAEYQEEAAQNQDGLTGLADLSNDKVSELAEMEYEGTEEMAKIYWYNDGNNDYDEYSEWCEKLSDVYLEEAKKIEDAYFASAN